MSATAFHRAMPARYKALAILGAVLLLLAAIAALPHVSNYSLEKQFDKQLQTAKRLEAYAARADKSKQHLAALSDPKIADNILLQGATAGLNGARLQSSVARLASRAGIRPHSLRVSEPENWQHGLQNISLEVGLRTSLEALQNFLYDIETNLPVLFIDTLTITRPERTGASTGANALDVTIVIRGVALGGVAQ